MSESRWCAVPFANLPKPSDVHRILVRSRDGEKYRTCRRQIADRHDDAKTLPLMHTLSPFLHRPPAHGDTSAYVEQTAAAAADLCKFEGGRDVTPHLTAGKTSCNGRDGLRPTVRPSSVCAEKRPSMRCSSSPSTPPSPGAQRELGNLRSVLLESRLKIADTDNPLCASTTQTRVAVLGK